MAGFEGRVVVEVFEPGGSGRGEFVLRTDGVKALCFFVGFVVLLTLYGKIIL